MVSYLGLQYTHCLDNSFETRHEEPRLQFYSTDCQIANRNLGLLSALQFTKNNSLSLIRQVLTDYMIRYGPTDHGQFLFREDNY